MDNATNPGRVNRNKPVGHRDDLALAIVAMVEETREERDFTISRTSNGFEANGQSYSNVWEACQAVGF